MKKTKLLNFVITIGTILGVTGCTEPIILDPASNPAELVENAYIAGNYSVKIECDWELTNEYMTYDEYRNLEESEFLEKYYSVLNDGTYVAQPSFAVYIYYCSDYVYFEAYDDGEINTRGIVINAVISSIPSHPTEILIFFQDADDESSYGDINLQSSYINDANARWQDYLHHLFRAYEEGTAEHLIYDEKSGTYDFDDLIYDESTSSYQSSAADEWILDLVEPNILWGCSKMCSQLRYVILNGDSKFGFLRHSYSLFDEENQELESFYEFCGMDCFAVDASNQLMPGMKLHFSATIYDVGETNKKDEYKKIYNFVHNELGIDANKN